MDEGRDWARVSVSISAVVLSRNAQPKRLRVTARVRVRGAVRPGRVNRSAEMLGQSGVRKRSGRGEGSGQGQADVRRHISCYARPKREEVKSKGVG